jgi:hypothetical protein
LPSGKIIEIEGSIALGAKVDLEVFSQAIETRLWDSVGRANWRPFDEARTFVQSLGLKSVEEWWEYARSRAKPPDIPVSPHYLYAKAGWVSYGDWLGTGRVAARLRQYRPFHDARAFVRALGLKSAAEWWDYCKSGKKPDAISGSPHLTYAGEGWAGLGDWLGTGTIAPFLRQYRPFEEARAFVHTLSLKSSDEWATYCKSGAKPDDIPTAASAVYKDHGWAGMGDWLGTGRTRSYRSFEQACDFVRELGLSSVQEWQRYCKSGLKPHDIPNAPEHVYRNSGWKSYSDWVGNGRNRNFLPFEKARTEVHKLCLNNEKEWRNCHASGKMPPGIPRKPELVYKSTGWCGWADWLRDGRPPIKQSRYRPFEDARAFVHTLGLSSAVEWQTFCKSGNKPDDIPANPMSVYAKEGWTSLGDWLGTGRIADQLRHYRDFKQARHLVRSLGLAIRQRVAELLPIRQ